MQDTLHEQPAPFPSPLAKLVGDAMDRLKGMPRSNPEFGSLVATLTGNFDEFPDVSVDGSAPGGVKRSGSSKAKHEFVGYTFKRAKDGVPVLSKGGGGSARARPGSAASKVAGGGGGAGAAGVVSPPHGGGSGAGVAAVTAAAASPAAPAHAPAH